MRSTTRRATSRPTWWRTFPTCACAPTAPTASSSKAPPARRAPAS